MGDYVDITEKSEVVCVEWFYGYGGNTIGLNRAIPGLRSIAVCEREAFVIANMVAKMEAGLLDPVPIWTDCKTFPVEPFKDRTDLFIASYPCQGFSHAGKRLGAGDERHLWPYCRKFIQGARPRAVWLENVEGHITLGLSTVLADLEEDGYKSAFGIFSASEVGAPHQRKRVFILAYDRSHGHPGRAVQDRVQGRGISEPAQSQQPEQSVVRSEVEGRGKRENVAILLLPRLEGHAGDGDDAPGQRGGSTNRPATPESLCGDVWPSRPGERQYAWEPPRTVVGDAEKRSDGQQPSERDGREMPGGAGEGTIPNPDGGNGRQQPRADVGTIQAGDGQSAGNSERQTQPPLGRDATRAPDGLDLSRLSGLSDPELEEIYGWMEKGTNRTDELRMAGNGVVPQTAERAFRVLYAELCGRSAPADDVVLIQLVDRREYDGV